MEQKIKKSKCKMCNGKKWVIEVETLDLYSFRQTEKKVKCLNCKGTGVE